MIITILKSRTLKSVTFDCDSFKQLRLFIDFIYNDSDINQSQDFRLNMLELNKIEIMYENPLKSNKSHHACHPEFVSPYSFF